MAKAHNPRVAAHNVEPSEVLHCVCQKPRRLRDLSHIGLEGHRVGSQALDLGDYFLGRFAGIGVIDDDFGTATAEFDRHGCANAAS